MLHNPTLTGIEIYKNDVVFEYAGGNNKPPPAREEGDITGFTDKSRQRLAFVAHNTQVDFTGMLTLTYPSTWPMDGRESKRHLAAFLASLRRKTDSPSYLWFLEFQRRGAPHYHMFVNRYVPKDWLSQRWYEIVGSDDEKHLSAGTNVEAIRDEGGARKYVVKYATKMYQKKAPKEFQNVGRFWGHSRDVKPEPVGYVEVADEVEAWELLERWEYRDVLKRGPIKIGYNAALPLAGAFLRQFAR